MKFEDIKKANETIMTLDVKGKPYAQVNERIKAFRMLYPEGIIDTMMISNENGVCVFKAQVGYYEDGVDGCVRWLGTGYAYEKENSTFINKTSYIENCETSAVGRALAMCGIGIDTSIASAEEVQNAINNQNNDFDKRLKLEAELQTLTIQTETDLEKVLNNYKKGSTNELTIAELENAINILKKKLK